MHPNVARTSLLALTFLSACAEPITPTNNSTPSESAYQNGFAQLETRDMHLVQNSSELLNPITSITAGFISTDSSDTPVCTLTATTQDPPAWQDQAQSASTKKGQRFFLQSAKQLYFFEPKSGTSSGIFTNGTCDVTAARLIDKPMTNDNFAVSRTPIPTKTFNGQIEGRVVTSLFNGALKIWTMPATESYAQCNVAVRFQKQAQNGEYDFTNQITNKEITSSTFYLERDAENGQEVYKFELTKRNDTKPGRLWGTNPAGNCDAKITQYILPAINLTGTAISAAQNGNQPTQMSPAAEALHNNIQMSFSPTTRVEIREANVPFTIQDGLHKKFERTVTSSNEVTFGDTSSSGLDVGSPIISALTGGLLSAEVKHNWENRFSRGVGQSTSKTVSVEPDPTICRNWLFNVIATVRDGTIDASGYGEKRPIPFSIVENIDIQAMPQCGPKM